jgi:hypothetical protein
VPALQSRVVKRGSVGLEVAPGRLSAAIATVTSDATAVGGFVSASTLDPGSASAPGSGSVTLSVPVASFEAVTSSVERTGTAKVTSLSTSGQDVTASYVDLQARIQSLQDARTQYEQVLTRAQSIGDILSVEAQLNDLQTQIEQLQGQLDVLNNQTSYSTLTVSITERPAPGVVVKPKPAPSGLARAWARARHSFAAGVDGIVGATGGIAVFVLVVGVLALVAWAAWRLRRRSAGGAPVAADGPGTQAKV